MPSMSQESVGDFFSHVSAEYDESIFKACPPYLDVLEALLGYIFIEPETKPMAILELGCGTGNLSRLLIRKFPRAEITLVDLSEDMLLQAESKIRPHAVKYELIQKGFMDVGFEVGRFDLIVSSFALHHLLDPEKKMIYKRFYQWLKPGGQFRCGDDCLAVPAEKAHEKNINGWLDWARKNGATETELKMWIDHGDRYDHYTALTDHFQWLKEAGFKNIDCYWRKYMWSVFGGEKP
jgi:tRNA (cmo5U34)-methyltransferase